MTPETADTIRHAADAVQWVNLCASMAILVIALEFGRRWKGARPYLAGPISWAGHSVVFYIVALFGTMSGPVASLWSAVLRLQGYAIVLSLLLAAFAVMLSPGRAGDYGEGPDE